ncbi:MAG: hypothetical protein J5I90_05985 [Caldilineales bacterium]|nr:hypothetical protein [Caldilineales bacterium]
MPVFSVIDVGQTPELKQVVLAGQLNASQCPNCRNVNYIAAPLLYHDPEHEFLGIFLPTQLNMSESQRQKAIGDLTKALMDSLPAEKRRGYMLNPQQFLTLDSLVEKLLGFEGITPAMIEASRKKVGLVDELMRVKDDGISFNLTVKENEALLDEEFFRLLSNFILSAQAQGDEQSAQQLADLREKLLPITTTGQKILKQRRAVQNLGKEPTRESVLEAIINADLDEVEAIAVVVAPALDYQFFQNLTDRIEAAPAEERPTLEEKRKRILEIVESMRAADQQAAQQSSQIIQELLGAEDMAAAVDEMLPYIDQTVMSLLLANIRDAEKRGAQAAVQRLTELWSLIVAATEEAMPPELRLLYQITDAEYPEGTRAVLKEHKAEITPEFLEFLKSSIDTIEQQDDGDPTERAAVARHLRNVLTQAQLGV